MAKNAAPGRHAAPRTRPSFLMGIVIRNRDRWACVCCGRPVKRQPYSLMPRKPFSLGGDCSPCNLLTVLDVCRARIESEMDPHDEAKGYTVWPHYDPALISVMYFEGPDGSGVTKWLRPDGSLSDKAPRRAA